MNSRQELFYKKVRYFLFLVSNGNYASKTNIKLPSEVSHNNLPLKIPKVIKDFLKASESNKKITYSEKEIKNILTQKYRLCNYFNWCDCFIHPFINLGELNNMSSNAKNYIISTILMEINYNNKGQNNINYNSEIYDSSKNVSFEEQIEIMEFMCKYGHHSQIGYIKELTYLNGNKLYKNCSKILNKQLPWTISK